MTVSKSTVRVLVSTSVIIVHLICFFYIVIASTAYTTYNERFDTALLLVPLTAAYVLAIGRRAISGQADLVKGSFVNAEYIIFVALITAAFLSALLFVTMSFPSKSIPLIESLRRAILVIEIGVGGSFGLIVEDLFGRVEKIIVPPEPQIEDTQLPNNSMSAASTRQRQNST